MPSRHNSSSPERPAKRSKVFRACQACVTAKTRCEDVQLEGCYLCRRKRKECSLRGISAPTTGSGIRERLGSYNGGESSHQRYDTHTPRSNRGGETGDTSLLLLDRLRMQEQRYRELEERLNNLEADQRESREQERLKQLQMNGSERNPVSSYSGSPLDIIPGGGGGGGASGSGGGGRGRQVIVPDYSIIRSFKKSLAPIFDEGLFCPINPAAYPDPVAMGIVTRPQMEMAFQLFKHRFSLFYPLSPFLRSSTPTPDHAFVRLAVLSHLNLIPPVDMAQLVEQSLSILVSGAVSVQSLLALFIMSLGPVQPCLETYAQPSGLRLISLAYHIGLDLGIGRQVELALRNKESLVQFWADEKMELTLLWTAIINRYNVLHILCTPTASLVPSPAFTLPDHAIESVTLTVAHLRAEVEMVDIAAALIDRLVVAENGWTEERLKESAEHLTATRQKLEEFRDRLPTHQQATSLMYDAKSIEVAMVFRYATFHQNLPSPIRPDIRMPGLHAIALNFFPCTKSIIEVVTELDTSNPPLIPAYVLSIVSIALLGLRRAAIHSHAVNPGVRSVDVESLQRVELKLHQLGGTPSLVLTQADDQFGKWPEISERQSRPEQRPEEYHAAQLHTATPTVDIDGGHVTHPSSMMADPLSTSLNAAYHTPTGDMYDFTAIGFDWMSMLFDPPNVNPYANANMNTNTNINFNSRDPLNIDIRRELTK
ncbi:hypothetical protein IAT40_001024 [Kwoniella sp. CBS 6097]